MKKNDRIRKNKSFNESLDIHHAKIEAKKYNRFEERLKYFVLSKALQKESKLVQKESMKLLAEFQNSKV